MQGDVLFLDLLFRGLAIGCLATTGAALVRGGANPHIRWASGLFAASTIAYCVYSSDTLRAALGPAAGGFWPLSVMGAGLTWLFLIVLFEDRPITPPLLAPPGVLLAVGVAGMIGPPEALPAIWITHNLFEVGLGAHALRVILRSWRGDLVEQRRRLRGPFLGAVCLYLIVLAAFEISESLGHDADWHRFAGSLSLAAFSVAGAIAFLAPRETLFGAAAPSPASTDPAAAVADADPLDRVLQERLEAHMRDDAPWKQEGLTIGALADRLAAPEHRLRRVIHDGLGHRNFAAFVNAYRIAAARAALSDPALASRTVAAIAFDAGFGSLGPFNRAFKEATGLTPTEFRLKALAES